MGPTPKSAGITAEPRLHYLRLWALSNWWFLVMNLKSAGTLCSQARFLRVSPNTTQRPVLTNWTNSVYPITELRKDGPRMLSFLTSLNGQWQG